MSNKYIRWFKEVGMDDVARSGVWIAARQNTGP